MVQQPPAYPPPDQRPGEGPGWTPMPNPKSVRMRVAAAIVTALVVVGIAVTVAVVKANRTASSAPATTTTVVTPTRARAIANLCAIVEQFQVQILDPSNGQQPKASSLAAESFKMGFLAALIGNPWDSEVEQFSNLAQNGDLIGAVNELDQMDTQCGLPKAQLPPTAA